MLLVTSVFLLCLLFVGGLPHETGSISPCLKVQVDNDHQMPYAGWPYKIKFQLFLEQSSYSAYQWIGEGLNYVDAVMCLVLNVNGTVIYNETATIDSLDKIEALLPALALTDSYFYYLELRAPKIQQCLYIELRLHATTYQPELCKDAMRVSYAILGGRYVLYGPDGGLMNSKARKEIGLEYHWETNCSNRVVGKGSNLTIPSVTFDDQGLYTCFETYNGMKRPIASERLIAKCPKVRLLSKPSFTCSDEVILQNVGGTALVKCIGRIGRQRPTSYHFSYRWKKVNDELKNGGHAEYHQCASSDYEDRHQRILCQFDIEKGSRKDCGATRTIDLLFRISNITEEDYGTYVLKLETILINAGAPTRANVTFFLQQNDVPELLNYPLVFGMIIFLTGALLLFLVLMHRVLRIRVFLKRHCGMYADEDQTYGAYLAYTYSRDFDRFSQGATKECVRATGRALEGMGYTVFDEKRDWSCGHNKAESTQILIQKSHRVVIFLTLCFIKDAWSMALLQQGFDEMIKCGKKLVFIIFPGILEYLDQYHSSDDGCLMIQRAIQLSYAIKWSNEDNFDKTHFNLQLEDAMPKLRSQKQNRVLEKSPPSCELSPTSSSYKGVIFQRCISNETDVTEVDFHGMEDMRKEVIEEKQ